MHRFVQRARDVDIVSGLKSAGRSHRLRTFRRVVRRLAARELRLSSPEHLAKMAQMAAARDARVTDLRARALDEEAAELCNSLDHLMGRGDWWGGDLRRRGFEDALLRLGDELTDELAGSAWESELATLCAKVGVSHKARHERSCRLMVSLADYLSTLASRAMAERVAAQDVALEALRDVAPRHDKKGHDAR